MGLLIEDGKGRGNIAGVNPEGKLETESVSISKEHHTNQDLGKAFNLLFSLTPTGAGDCFLYMKNSSTIDLILEGVILRTGGNEIITFNLNDTGTPAGGTVVTPANLNAGSGETAIGTFQTGVNITGLSGGTLTERLYVASSDDSSDFNFDQDIIIPQNNVFTMWATTGSIAIAGTVVFNYHD